MSAELEGGSYILTNCDTGLPIHPESFYENSNIVAGSNQHDGACEVSVVLSMVRPVD